MDIVRDFFVRTIVAAGGVVESTGEALEALVPEDAQQRLGLAEETRIRLRGERDGHDVDGRFGSSLLERLIRERLGRAPLATARLPNELPRSLPAGSPVLLNAVRSGEAREERRSERYLVCDLHLVLRGDEVRSTLATVTIRLADGARVAPFRLADAYPTAAVPLAEAERRRAESALRSWTRDEGPELLARPLETLRRRAARDLERLTEYFASLDREMAAAVDRARSDEERARRRRKRQGLPAELVERRAQVRERLRVRLSAALVAGLIVETEVAHFAIPIRRRARDGSIEARVRAADGLVEGPCCAACGVETTHLYLCDDRLHVLCTGCGGQGRLDPTRCRACSRAGRAPLSIVVDDPTSTLRLGGQYSRRESLLE